MTTLQNARLAHRESHKTIPAKTTAATHTPGAMAIADALLQAGLLFHTVPAARIIDQHLASSELLATVRAIINERDSAALSDDPAYLMIDRAIDKARLLISQATQSPL